MRRKKLLWHLYPSYLLITLFALLAITWYSSRSLKSFYYDQAAENLKLDIELVKGQFISLVTASDSSSVNRLCRDLAGDRKLRLTVILPSGTVIGDSEESPDSMDNHADRVEIVEAGRTGQGRSVRYSYTLRQNMMYVAVPLYHNDTLIGYLRASMPVTAIESALRNVYIHIALGGLIVAVIAAGISFMISRRITRPLVELKKGAEEFAGGNLGYRLPAFDSLETGALAEAMSDMAQQLNERLRAITHQRNEQEAVLSSMVEAVVAVDADEKVISINRAAGRLLYLEPAAVQGRILHEVARNFELQEFVSSVLKELEPAEAELAFLDENDQERIVQAHGSILRSATGDNMGAVIVLNDITRLRKLERVRRDFVANVSHELKTPVTSIKGFVETLLDGAVHDPDNAGRFLEIISRQANRLNAIIEDLLTLSRIESEAEKAEVILEMGTLKEVILAAVQVCRARAQEKNINIKVGGENDIKAKINAPLLEQAVINLIDNAIKYSDAGSEVYIETITNPANEAVIRVVDHGCGIAPEHLNRVFERFYRIDKARSRELGGTGLGLAIVKHIAQAHQGRVNVTSKLDKGSTFEIIIPFNNNH